MPVQTAVQKLRRSMSLAVALVVAAASLLTIVPPAPASANGSVIGGWYALSWEVRPKLFRIDKSTGEAVLVATATVNVGNDGVAAFDVDGTTGIGYLFTYDGGEAELWSVDLSTGAFAKIGNVTGVENVVAFDIGIDGSFWIYADRTNPAGEPGFGTVDRSTAAFTRLGDGPERLSAFASDIDGKLIGIAYSNDVYRYDRTSSTWTKFSELPSFIYAADFDVDGTLLAQGWSGDLYRIDVTGTPVSSNLVFTFSGADWASITNGGGEAFAVAGPSDGRTLAQALGLAPTPGGGMTEPSSSPSWVATPTGFPPLVGRGVAELQRGDGTVGPLVPSTPGTRQVRYATDEVSVTFTGAAGTDASTGLVARPDGTVECEICAQLAAGQVVEVWLFSEPRLLAAWRLEDLPCQRFTIPLGAPLDGGGPVPAGAHTLQLALPTASGLQAVNIGVTVGSVLPVRIPAGGGPVDGATGVLPLLALMLALGFALAAVRRRSAPQ
jgi:hypothetical protein